MSSADLTEFPANGIIYTATEVRFIKAAIMKFLPEASTNIHRLYKAQESLSVKEFVEVVKGIRGCTHLVNQLQGSAIAYKPFDGPALYVFKHDGAVYLLHCEDAFDYKTAVIEEVYILSRAPTLARSLGDGPHRDGTVAKLAAKDIRLAARGDSLDLIIGNGDAAVAEITTIGTRYAS